MRGIHTAGNTPVADRGKDYKADRGKVWNIPIPCVAGRIGNTYIVEEKGQIIPRGRIENTL